jgi:hypothetical protein
MAIRSQWCLSFRLINIYVEIFLGMQISNSVQKEIQRHILAGNRIYFAATSLFRNRLTSKEIGLEVNAEKTEHMVVSFEQNAGENNIKLCNNPMKVW